MEDEPDLGKIVQAIVAGTSVDWSATESKSTGDSRRTALRDLKLVAEIAHFHETLHESAAKSVPDWLSRDPAADQPPSVWGSFTLLEHIGRGSFGDVYRAWDGRLDREVALKLIRRSDASPTHPDSVTVREGRLLARVSHPNIVTVHGADIVNGEVGVWMEFIRGRTLEACVCDQGPFGVADAAAIGIAVCRALAAVHSAGLIHRDVKAQNVMRQDDGRVVLMDFGAGQLAEGATAGVVGTPLYLAPELLAGSPATPQSDVYSLGVLVYHLVTGRYPVDGKSVSDVRDAHRRQEKTPLRTARPNVPGPFALVVERSLSADPAKRFDGAEEFEVALARATPTSRRRRWVAAGATAIALSVLALGAARWWPRSVHAPQPATWVLIGPFENGTGDASLDGAIRYALERELVNSHSISVAPRDRIDDALRLMLRPAGTPLDLLVAREVCLRDGGITALITGRVERIGTRLAITADILNAATGALLASPREVAATPGDLVAAVQREALDIRQTLGETRASLEASRREFERVTTPSLQALQSYSEAAALMHGPGVWQNGTGIWPNGVIERYLREALNEDPRFASAHVLLAWTLRDQGRPATEYLREADEAFGLAAGLTDVERHFIDGSVHDLRGLGTRDETTRAQEFDRATVQYEMVLREQPNHYWAAGNASRIYQAMERTDALTGMLERLADMRPNAFDLNARAALAIFGRGDSAGAAPYATKALAALLAASGTRDARLDIDPTYAAFVEMFPAYSAWQHGDVAGATSAVDHATRLLAARDLPEQTALAARAAEMDATLGRLLRAREVAQLIPDATVRDRTRIHFLWLSGDLQGVTEAIHALRGPKPTFDAIASMMTEAGMTRQARELLNTSRVNMLKNGVANDAGGERYLNAFEVRLAFNEHRYSDAAAFGERFMSGLPQGPRPMNEMITAGSLADALKQLGALPRAIAVLETFTTYRPDLNGEGYVWLRLRLQLSQLYRLAGRSGEAHLVEHELLKLLSRADPDFSLLRQLDQQMAAQQ